MQRTTEGQREHDALIDKVVKMFEGQSKYREVQAQLDGHRWPGKIKWKGDEVGQVPDAQAKTDREKGVVVEVETRDSIHDEHTENQWRLFSKFARAKRWTFWIVVPKGQEEQARLRAMMLRLKRYKVYGLELDLGETDDDDDDEDET